MSPPTLRAVLPLLTVEATFQIDGLGLVLSPDPPVADVRAAPATFGVRVVRPDGTVADCEAVLHRVHVRQRGRAGARSLSLALPKTTTDDVPVGSVVLCTPRDYATVTGARVANGRTTPTPPVDVVAAVPALGPLRRRTVRLHPRPGEPRADGSGLGGSTVLWPEGHPLPTCDAHGALVPVLQLARDDVPELPFRAGETLFQLWWCPHDHPEAGYAPTAQVVWRAGRETLVPTTWSVPLSADPGYVPVPCRLHPERVAELPGPGDLADDLERAVRDHPAVQDAAAAWPYHERRWQFVTPESRARMTVYPDQRSRDAGYLYQTCLSAAPGVKVGGHERWVQDPNRPSCPVGHAMDLLVTIDATEFDGASLDRWLALEDGEAWSRAPAERRVVQSPTGLALGDGGNLHVYVCPTCPDRPTATVHQSC